jgi:phosphoglycerol transferase MdoB-like AlkP superfamily enzyme
MFFFNTRIYETQNFLYIFPIGLRLDVITLCYLSFLPAVLISLLPDNILQYLNKFLSFYFISFLLLILFMEIATPNFMVQFDTRPNRLFIDYLKYPKEVIGTLLESFLYSMIFTVLALSIALFYIIKFSSKLFNALPALYTIKLVAFPFLVFLLIFGVRSSFTSKRPINASNAVFSIDQLTNSLCLNSFYTVANAAYSIKNEADASKMYGKMGIEEAINRVKKYMTAQSTDFTDSNLPTLHQQLPDVEQSTPYNLVIFLQESLGAEFVGSLGGLPLTPEFDKLTQKGLLFTNLYCTGTRSVRGIEAVVSGYLPSPSESVLKLSNSQIGFYTIAESLKQKGYETSFIYGGMSNFDNMASFFNGNCIDDIIDQDDLTKNATAEIGIWGFADDYLVEKANEYYKSKGDKPFFSLMFSTSNHDPFQFPDGKIELYEQPKNTVHNAIKYADFSIGKFFELAKKEAYFKKTIFIVIADHNTRTNGKHLVPIHKFHIPALIIGPNIKEGDVYKKLCSQIDMAPTLLNMIGVKVNTPMVGRNLLQLPENIPGRAIMQFHDINAFRVEDQVVIMQPYVEPLQFQISDKFEMTPTKLDLELAKDALAHVLTANYLYKESKYKGKK